MKNRYLILLVLTLFIAAGCTDRFEDFNKDRKNPPATTPESLFSYGLIELSDQISSTNVNLNVFKLWSQYWTETTYIDEANYDILNRTVADGTFRALYRNSMKNFRDAKTILMEDEPERVGDIAVLEILEAYTMVELIDLFGDVPYEEALDNDIVAPKFDDAASLYLALGAKVQAAITTLDEASVTFGSEDFVFGGDTELWGRFGAGLLIKMGITIADVDETTAEAWITANEAIAIDADGNGIEALLDYQSSFPNTNTLYEDLVLSGRSDFVAANTVVDIMNGLDDPRREVYFQLRDTSSIEGVEHFVYIGGAYGYPSPYSAYSAPGVIFEDATFPGLLMTESELLFYLAEAAARGMAVSNTDPEVYYNDAITSSINWWAAMGGTSLDAAAYLANPAVAYATAEGDWKQKIATQSWIASYSRGFIGWTTWRRLDWPIFNLAERTDSHADIPTRFTYPVNEQTLNADNWSAASTAIGGDFLTTKLYWDINPVNVPE